MIFYFSACGNSKYVATRVASATDDEILSIDSCLNNHNLSFDLASIGRIGIVVPVYFLGLPNIVNEFLEKVNFKNSDNSYFYTIITYGTTTGAASQFVKKAFEKKSIKINAAFCVKYPDTFVPLFNVSNKTAINKKVSKAEPKVNKIIEKILNKDTGNFIINKIPYKSAVKQYQKQYKKNNNTNNFKVDDSCISCGLCEKQCPVAAIKLRDGKPVWIKSECVLCLGCLHRCPVAAIEFGKNSKKHGQYLNLNVKF